MFPLLHLGAKLMCLHGGQAETVAFVPQVLVSGMPIVLQTSIYTISGCSYPPAPLANGPCVTAQWVTAATRVTSNRVPVLLQNSQAICASSGTRLEVIKTQTRVTGQ
jgi:uncharacterized Zn-binding protein involved in type VI secretion